MASNVRETLGSTAKSSSVMIMLSTKVPAVPSKARGTRDLTRPIEVAMERMGFVDWNLVMPLVGEAPLATGLRGICS